jgi:hypothetical protein
MAPSFTARAGPFALHVASMAKPYSHSKGACRRDCVAGNRDLALCDTLRGWVHFAINGPRSRRSEIPGIWASQSRQPWMAYYFHWRAARLLPGGSAEQIRDVLGPSPVVPSATRVFTALWFPRFLRFAPSGRRSREREKWLRMRFAVSSRVYKRPVSVSPGTVSESGTHLKQVSVGKGASAPLLPDPRTSSF